MEPQPTIEIVKSDEAGNNQVLDWHPRGEAIGLHSLLPGTDWYLWGGVAFRGKPCGNPNCLIGLNRAHVEVLGATDAEDCPSCHGWGVTPIDGSIAWRCAEGFGGPSCKTLDEPGLHDGCGWVLALRLDGNGGK